MKKIKVSDYVIEYIKNQGINDIFLLPGGGNIHLIDSIGKIDINFVCNLHEQACSAAADAYSQYTNNLGVCLVTTGPGGTNAITGLAASWLDSTPVLFLSGQVQKKDMTNNKNVRQIGFQEINIVNIVKSITKYAVTILDPYKIKYHLEKAIYLAKNGRPGPVWIDIPLDVQSAIIDKDLLIGYVPKMKKKINLKFVVSDIINNLNASKRPILLAGNGIRLSNAIDTFLELSNILQIPILTTWKAIDFIEEDHKLFVGRPGAVGQRGANFSQQNSDFLISIGARLDHGQTAYQHKYFAKNAKKVIVDIDKNEIKKLDMNIDYSIVIDANEFIKEFLNQKDKININCKEWLNMCKKWQKKYPVCLQKYWNEKDYVNNYVFIDVLSDVLPEKSLIIPGSSGCCSEVTMQSFKMKKNMRMFNCEGLGPMGFGIAASIGACIASNYNETICIDGDGSFAMNIQELETVHRLNLPIKFFILNNKGYLSIRMTQNVHFNGKLIASDESSGLTLPNLKKNALAYNIPYILINNHNNIYELIKKVIKIKGPVICEVMINPNHITAPKISVYKDKNNNFIARPMEDLFPFLNRDEFNKNMIVDEI